MKTSQLNISHGSTTGICACQLHVLLCSRSLNVALCQAAHPCRWLSTLGVPRLRAIFLDVFGHHTASNNGAWLRRKLAEPAEGGRGRAVQIRARDAAAAIWTTGRVKGVSKVSHEALLHSWTPRDAAETAKPVDRRAMITTLC